jgi:hypothetical protein
VSEHHWNDEHGPDRLYDKFTVVPTKHVWHGDPLTEEKVFDSQSRLGEDGEFVFVLRPERDLAAWIALMAYARSVEHRAPNLAEQIETKLIEIQARENAR